MAYMFKSLSTAGGVTRRVAFIDGSGQTAVCNCVVLAGIVYEGPASYVYAFGDYVDALRRRYGIAGELKWRELWRRGGAAAAEELEKLFDTAWVSLHYRGQASLAEALWSLMRRLRAHLYVVDEGLVNPRAFPRTMSRPSHKVPGTGRRAGRLPQTHSLRPIRRNIARGPFTMRPCRPPVYRHHAVSRCCKSRFNSLS